MNNINFTANLLKYTEIPKRNSDGEYAPFPVAVVELDINDSKDTEALRKTSIDWYYLNDRFSAAIYNEAVKGFEYDDIQKEHYFAVTTQLHDFKNLEYKKILGLMLFSNTNRKEDEINFLQVKPTENSIQNSNREYKHVGKTFIDLLKNANYKKPIMVKSVLDSIGFYIKEGFRQRDEDVPTQLYLDVTS